MRYSEEEKEMWVEDWRQSGKSALAYAKGNGLNAQTFVRWTKAGSEERLSFVEVRQHLPMPIPSPEVCEILIEKGEVKIHLPLSMGRSELRAVMEGLGGVL
jgi:transposase-like protein